VTSPRTLKFFGVKSEEELRSGVVMTVVAVVTAGITIADVLYLDGGASFAASMVSSSLLMLIWAYHVSARRMRRIAYAGLVLAILTGLFSGRRFAADEAPSAFLIAGVSFVLFVLPMPLLIVLFRRSQDELQRSLATSAAAISFGTLMIAALGHFLLDAAVELPLLPPVVLLPIGLFVWASVWLVLRAGMR
jgi:hypothetical protein